MNARPTTRQISRGKKTKMTNKAKDIEYQVKKIVRGFENASNSESPTPDEIIRIAACALKELWETTDIDVIEFCLRDLARRLNLPEIDDRARIERALRSH